MTGNRLHGLYHAIQSAIAFQIARGSSMATPKYLRVGVDTAKAEAGGLADLLIAKGVFTADEYSKAMHAALESEVDRQTEAARKLSGMPSIGFL